MAALFITACSGHKVTTDYDPDVSFEALRTFAVILPKEHAADTLRYDRINKALTRHLETKGYRLTDESAADFHLLFFTRIVRDVADNVGFGLGLGRFSGGSGISLGTSLRGSSDKEVLIVKIVDPDEGRTLWHGSLTDTARTFTTPREREAHIQKSIDRVLGTFPKR